MLLPTTASMASVNGLTSQDAQARLHDELKHFTSRSVKIKWLSELFYPPCSMIMVLLLFTVGILLIADFAIQQDDGMILFQGIFLVLLAVLNWAFLCWEVFILKTRRIRRLLSKLNPYISHQCPWTAASYPKSSICTVGGNFTVPTFRDGSLVHLPASLLVSGDVIQLHKSMPTPAKVVYSDPEVVKSLNDAVSFDIGETPPDYLFGEERDSSMDSVRFVPEMKPLHFTVVDTPVVALLESAVTRKRPKTFLTKERNYILNVMIVLVVIVYCISLVVNIIRLFVLPEDFSNSLPEIVFRIPSYTVLPLLNLPLPLMWTLFNVYGTSRITLLVENGPEIFKNRKGVNHYKMFSKTLSKMFAVVFQCSMYPNYRAFHIFGSLTSVCAVDKEHVLTSAFPIPEKVFFLKSDECAEEKNKQSHHLNIASELQEVEEALDDAENARMDYLHPGLSSATTMSSQQSGSVSMKESMDGELEGNFNNASLLSVNSRQCTAPVVDIVVQTSSPTLEGSMEKDINFRLSVSSIDREASDQQESTVSGSRVLKSALKPASMPDSVSATSVSSVPSDTAPFEVTTEILDLSAKPQHFSGVSFDDKNWESHISSLKPVGVCALATSHMLEDAFTWSPTGSSKYLKKHIHQGLCVCSLGVEIGVTEYSTSLFKGQNDLLLYSIGPQTSLEEKSPISHRSAFTTGSSLQPHILSTAIYDQASSNYIVMSRGSGEMVASCCSDFWDGRDLQPMTEVERTRILDFFARRNLSSHCIALAYNPVIQADVSSFKNQRLGLHIPSAKIHQHFNDVSMMLPIEENGSVDLSTLSAEQVFTLLQRNQVFLGLVSLQFQARLDIVLLIELLETAGIRFVHFTAENEIRGKIFAQKLGLEADWNCHISLAPALEEVVESSSEGDSDLDSDGTHSTASSLSSVINTNQSYIRARLPKGIDNVRPHITSVDNVPLLVPLFTDCTTEAVQEMIEIMQENSEVVMCIGNAWNRDNLSVFSQADISVSLVPSDAAAKCGDEVNTLVNSTSSSRVGDHVTWPSPLEMASCLNSATCQLTLDRDSNVGILSLISESRHILSLIRQGFLFSLGCSCFLTLLMLFSTLFFLPSPLNGNHMLWFLLFTVPVIVVSLFGAPIDSKINSQMPNRKRKVWGDQMLYLLHFACMFVPSVAVCLLIFGLTLTGICNSLSDSECHVLLGDRNLSNTSWNGWRGEYEQGLILSQDIVAFFISLYFVVFSIRFVHRTEPLWKLWRFVSWQYIVLVTGTFLLQIVHFAINQALIVNTYGLQRVADLSSVPFYVWVVGFAWPVVMLPVQEALKYHDKRLYVREQCHIKLEFETKLGMHSPI